MDNENKSFMSTNFSFVDEFEQKFVQQSIFDMDAALEAGESPASMLSEEILSIPIRCWFHRENYCRDYIKYYK